MLTDQCLLGQYGLLHSVILRDRDRVVEGGKFTRALTHGLNSGGKESDELMYRIKLEIISSLSVTAGSPECSDLAGSCQDL